MKQLFLRIIKFICSSLLSFVIDLALYKILFGPFGDVIANICARVVSASFNFTVNRIIVLKAMKRCFRLPSNISPLPRAYYWSIPFFFTTCLSARFT